MSDPYGYPDALPDDGGSAITGMWCGIGAALCAALGPCSCYMSYLPALPLGIVAMVYGFRGLSAAHPNAPPANRQCSLAALVSGIIALIPSLLILIGMLIYAVILIVMVIAGAADNSF